MARGKRILILGFGAVLLVAICVAGRRFVYRYDRVIQGRRESEWIRSLTNLTSISEIVGWQKLGTDAVPILVRAAGLKDGTAEKAYAAVWGKLPASARTKIPAPVDYSRFRLGALAMMTMIKIDPGQYPLVLGCLDRCLGDTNSGVRANAINVLANNLPRLGRERDLWAPRVVQWTRDTDTFVRMIAASSLECFSNRVDIVYPALKGAMQDNDADVRLRAAMAGYHLDPTWASNAGALNVAYDCLHVHTPHGAEVLAERFLKEIGKYDERPYPPPDRAPP